ncbi:MAG TPA: hypothetical protein VH477_17505, partial [Bryobacteraceae bacterium]
GDFVTISYKCASAHDLYLGTSLFNNRGIVSVTLDGDAATSLDCFLNVTSEVVTRRLLRKSVAPGTHTVIIRLLANNHQAIDPGWDITSLGYTFLFDYLEAAVPSDIPDAAVTYPNVSAALDYDTDATYKVSPQRLLWHLQKLGLAGQVDEYLGVYWWNQRKRINAAWNSAVFTFSGTWAPGDSAAITVGNFTFRKAVTQWDTLETIAAHFVYYINASSVSTWAEKTGPGQLTVHVRSPLWSDTYSVSWSSAGGRAQRPGHWPPVRMEHGRSTHPLPAPSTMQSRDGMRIFFNLPKLPGSLLPALFRWSLSIRPIMQRSLTPGKHAIAMKCPSILPPTSWVFSPRSAPR